MASFTATICGASTAFCCNSVSSVNTKAQHASRSLKFYTATKSGQSTARHATRVKAFSDASDSDSPSVVPREESPSSTGPLSSSKPGVKGFGAPKAETTDKKRASKPVSVRRAPPSKPLIGVQADPQTQQIEKAVVTSLAVLFTIILFEGIFLAVSGFLPDELDQFAVNTVYPAYTPSVGIFLIGAAGYGLWKYLGGGTR